MKTPYVLLTAFLIACGSEVTDPAAQRPSDPAPQSGSDASGAVGGPVTSAPVASDDKTVGPEARLRPTDPWAPPRYPNVPPVEPSDPDPSSWPSSTTDGPPVTPTPSPDPSTTPEPVTDPAPEPILDPSTTPEPVTDPAPAPILDPSTTPEPVIDPVAPVDPCAYTKSGNMPSGLSKGDGSQDGEGKSIWACGGPL